MTCEFATLDGAYVLGSLSPTERADYERHLGTCKGCSRSVRELAGLPGLLGRVPADLLEQPASEPVPATLLPRLLVAAERSQRRRTVRSAFAAAAAVAAIAGGSVALAAAFEAGDDSSAPVAGPTVTVRPPTVTVSPETAPRERMDAVQRSGAKGWVSLTPVRGGTRLDLNCRYEGRHVYTYEVVVRTADGREETGGTFTAVPGKWVPFVGQASVSPEDIVEVVVGNDYGAILRLTR